MALIAASFRRVRTSGSPVTCFGRGDAANYCQAIFDGWDVDALRLRFSAQIDIVLAGVRAGSQPH